MSALLGGFAITSAAWIGANTLLVRFDSTYVDRFHQLYLGRTLIGISGSFAARNVQGVGSPSHYPEELQLVAVTADDRLTDFGWALPPRPYNRVNLGWTTAGWGAAGVKKIEIVAGDAPGGAVDVANVLARIPFDTDRTYGFVTDPLEGSGTWNFGVAGRDGTLPLGNRGTELDIACAINARPPDVALAGDGTRLTESVSAGNWNIGFSYNW
jgi:hypothetical protein